MAIIAIDFDGTLADHKYPKIGHEIPLAVKTCRELQAAGHSLILLTMRSGDELRHAVEWCKERGLGGWYGVNENPSQDSWTESRKVYAHHYIDDAAVGCPLRQSEDRPQVDWVKVRRWLAKNGFLNKPVKKASNAD